MLTSILASFLLSATPHLIEERDLAQLSMEQRIEDIDLRISDERRIAATLRNSFLVPGIVLTSGGALVGIASGFMLLFLSVFRSVEYVWNNMGYGVPVSLGFGSMLIGLVHFMVSTSVSKRYLVRNVAPLKRERRELRRESPTAPPMMTF